MPLTVVSTHNPLLIQSYDVAIFIIDHVLFAPANFLSRIACLVDDISCICWVPDGEHLASAGGEDRYIRLWRNTAGMRERIKEINEKIGTASSEPLKVRLIFYMHMYLCGLTTFYYLQERLNETLNKLQ